MKLDDDYTNFDEFEENMSEELFTLWLEFQEAGSDGLDYPELIYWQKKFEPYGLTFDFSLDAEPFDLEYK